MAMKLQPWCRWQDDRGGAINGAITKDESVLPLLHNILPAELQYKYIQVKVSIKKQTFTQGSYRIKVIIINPRTQ